MIEALFWPNDDLAEAQTKKERYRKWIRKLARAGVILIPILSLSSVAVWFYLKSLPAKNIIVLVADFDGPDPKNYRVTESIIEQLNEGCA